MQSDRNRQRRWIRLDAPELRELCKGPSRESMSTVIASLLYSPLNPSRSNAELHSFSINGRELPRAAGRNASLVPSDEPPQSTICVQECRARSSSLSFATSGSSASTTGSFATPQTKTSTSTATKFPCETLEKGRRRCRTGTPSAAGKDQILRRP
jgi:hypothetical protein